MPGGAPETDKLIAASVQWARNRLRKVNVNSQSCVKRNSPAQSQWCSLTIPSSTHYSSSRLAAPASHPDGK
jgi:hypothetical protein